MVISVAGKMPNISIPAKENKIANNEILSIISIFFLFILSPHGIAFSISGHNSVLPCCICINRAMKLFGPTE